MRLHRVFSYTLLYGIALGLGATVASSCLQPEYELFAFRCNPGLNNGCPVTHRCCSTDPAAEGGRLPDYEGKDIDNAGTPIFSGQNNALSVRGMCVDVDSLLANPPPDILLEEPNAFGCLTPCNPTWSNSDVDEVCGTGARCCQVEPLGERDCVRDEGTGLYRPVTGADINRDTVTPRTDWAGGSHNTHQAPGGRNCEIFADARSPDPVYLDCVAQLTVASERGFCIPNGFECGFESDDYEDVCSAMND